MSLSQRISAGLAIGAAALAIPFAASPASADDWEAVGGFGDYETCMSEGHSYVHEEDNNHDFTEFKCVDNGGAWTVMVR